MRKLNKKGLFFISVIMAGSMAAMSGCGASKEPVSAGESEAAVRTVTIAQEETVPESAAGSETESESPVETESEAETTTEAKAETESETKTGQEPETESKAENQPQSTFSEEAEPVPEAVPAAEGSVSAGDYAVTIGGLMLPLGDDMRNYVGVLGEPDAYGAAKSCTEAGDDKVYTYGGTTIYTYITNGADIISLIEITGGEYLPSGIHIGSTKEEVIAAYGSAYIEEGTEWLYETGSKTIGLQMTDNKVSFIELFGQ
ncbi:MAG: hypothetical protein K2N73_11420 [Lachnospiraceae bacterium]|nr:hypothetical protein [Lachnospiraceae bacterium]